jgi:glycosyltransferase involved in cell wall biosynthesis
VYKNPSAIPARVCIVIPCYNEASRLKAQLFRDYLAAHAGIRFLFVDDGSADSTAQVLEELCIGYEDRAEFLVLKPNGGKAEAVRRGILHAVRTHELDAVGYWDADLATPLAAISGFHDVLSRYPNKEMVFGSRVKLLGRAVKRRALRHYLGRVFATAASVTLRLPIYDTQCGAKLFRVNPHLQKVFSEPFLSKWVFDVEIVARYSELNGHSADKMESCVYEYALKEWSDVAGSKVRPRDFFTAMLDLLRIKLHYFG